MFRRRIFKLYEEARSSGFPLSSGDVFSPLHIGYEPSAIDARFLELYDSLIQATSQQLGGYKLKFGGRSLHCAMNSVPSSDREFVSIAEPYLDQICQHLQQPGCRLAFAKDWDLSTSLSFPEFAAHKNVVTCLTTRAAIKASDGLVAEAINDLVLCASLLKCLYGHPTLIGLLVHFAEHAILARCATWCMGQQPTYADQFAAIVESATCFDIRSALRGEAYFQIATVRNAPSSLFIGDAAPHADIKNVIRSGYPQDSHQQTALSVLLGAWLPLIKDCPNEGDLDVMHCVRAMRQYSCRILLRRLFLLGQLRKHFTHHMATSARAVEMRYEHAYCCQLMAKAISYWLISGKPAPTLGALGYSEIVPFVNTKIKMEVSDHDVFFLAAEHRRRGPLAAYCKFSLTDEIKP